MTQILYQYLAGDHRRIEALLDRAAADPGAYDMESYAGFRQGLLRHIGIEEKIVLPEIARLQGGRPADMAGRLRLDHGAIVSLLVPPPSASIIATLRAILAAHNEIEEGENGLYPLLESLAGGDAERLLEQMKAAPEVPVLPHNAKPIAYAAARRAVERAGHEFKDTA